MTDAPLSEFLLELPSDLLKFAIKLYSWLLGLHLFLFVGCESGWIRVTNHGAFRISDQLVATIDRTATPIEIASYHVDSTSRSAFYASRDPIEISPEPD